MPPPPSAEGIASRLLLGPALRAQPDQRLVRLVREGYEAAFEEIVRRYAKPLQRYAAAIVGGRAEDVTQDAFSKALLALRRDDREIQLRPWLYRIVRNAALNDIRDRPPPAQVLEEAIQSGAGPEEAAERRAEVADLITRLRSLPEPQRAAIVMRELEGLSHEEIAAALGLSDGAARQAIYRARQALRDGAGLLIPLPLVRLLAEHGPEAAVAAGAGGVAVAGIGTATKVGVVTVLVAGSVGAGVALEERSSPDPARAAEEPTATQPAPAGSSLPPNAGGASSGSTGGGERRDVSQSAEPALDWNGPAAGEAEQFERFRASHRGSRRHGFAERRKPRHRHRPAVDRPREGRFQGAPDRDGRHRGGARPDNRGGEPLGAGPRKGEHPPEGAGPAPGTVDKPLDRPPPDGDGDGERTTDAIEPQDDEMP